MLISFAMICSCQKQDSAAERQLAQRKSELDAREKALDEREKAVAERENAVANSRVIPSRRQVSDPAQVKAERDKIVQQLLDQRQRRLQESQRTQAQMQGKDAMSAEQLERMKIDAAKKAAMSAGAASAAAAEATSPTPSPTPQ